MPAFLLKRLLNAAGVMLAVAFLAFLIFRFVGDPVELMLNEQASQQQRDELRVRLGLDKGFVMQYATFVGNAVRGDFGISLSLIHIFRRSGGRRGIWRRSVPPRGRRVPRRAGRGAGGEGQGRREWLA